MASEEISTGVEIGGGKRGLRRFFHSEDRARLLAEFDRSGQSVREFCGEHAVGQSSLTAWRRRRREQDRSAGAASVVKVGVSKSAAGTAQIVSASSRVTIRTGSGWEIEAAVGTEVQWLSQLTQALAACSA